MKRLSAAQYFVNNHAYLKFPIGFLILFASFFSIELVVFFLMGSADPSSLAFGALWSALLSAVIVSLPRKSSRIVYGIVYFALLLWSLAQVGYYQVFDKMMWLSTIAYAGEGAAFLMDVLINFPLMWYLAFILMIGAGVLILLFYPQTPRLLLSRIPCLLVCIVCVLVLSNLPEQIFQRDDNIGGNQNEDTQVSYQDAYDAMYDAKLVYDFTGIYHLTYRDFWFNNIYPLTPDYTTDLEQQANQIDSFFQKRGPHTANAMTGTFAGKNVIMVLMESMDDWMITEEETPTLVRLMNEGINFTNFYTPYYGSARTLNSEFCMNTGIYLPTTGSYVFDYLTNSFNQSFASQMTANGYSAKVFHYNDPSFYSRDELEPAMGYDEYISYKDYVQDEKTLCSDNLVFDIPEVNELFFREGQTFNTIITRAAHLGYSYREIITYYALQDYPEYRGRYPSEEEDSARLKAKLVDDMFARLLEELEAHGQLENTVIIAMTDHYTYGYKNMEELYSHSGVEHDLLLEKTPCFVWSADGPAMKVDKLLNTSDFLPTMLNLLGIDSPYNYLGQDAFDPNYAGYVLFADGSWMYDGVAYQNGQILMNETNREVTKEEIDAFAELIEEYRNVSNMLLINNYYK